MKKIFNISTIELLKPCSRLIELKKMNPNIENFTIDDMFNLNNIQHEDIEFFLSRCLSMEDLLNYIIPISLKKLSESNDFMVRIEAENLKFALNENSTYVFCKMFARLSRSNYKTPEMKLIEQILIVKWHQYKGTYIREQLFLAHYAFQSKILKVQS